MKNTALIMAAAMMISAAAPAAAVHADGMVSEMGHGDASQTTHTKLSEDPYAVKTDLNAIGKSVTFRFSPNMFNNTAIYDHGLAKASLMMSVAAMDSGRDDADIKRFFKAAGFDMDTYTQYRYDNEDDSDDAAVGICTLTLPGGKKIVAAAVRGGGYGGEWSSNMRLGDSTVYHEGFMRASSMVKRRIDAYIEDQGLTDYSMWIVGYSRGGAVAGLTAARTANDIGQDRVYAYTFAAPRSYKTKGGYKCIHNIVDPSDAVPYLPFADWGFERPGVTHYLDLSAYGDKRRKNIEKLYKAMLEDDKTEFDPHDLCLPVMLCDIFHEAIPTAVQYENEGYQEAFAHAALGTDDLIAGTGDIGTVDIAAQLESELPLGSGLTLVRLYATLMQLTGEEDEEMPDRNTMAHLPQNYIALLYAAGIVKDTEHIYTVTTDSAHPLYITSDGEDKGSIVRSGLITVDVVQPEHPALWSYGGVSCATVLGDETVEIGSVPVAEGEEAATDTVTYTVNERLCGDLIATRTYTVTLDGSRYTVNLQGETE
ncbi:MAG: hypothetical protein IKR73_07690 [Oscillospiraceae bacterium]|nr:hypothetical protein [Oscillospiraceae bacterium]